MTLVKQRIASRLILLMKQLHTQKLTPTRLLFLVPMFLVVVSNGMFFDKVLEIYPWDLGNATFIVSLSLFLYTFILLLMLIFSFVLPVRVVASWFFIMSATIRYYSNNLGIVIDADMIRNVLQTNIDEAADLINVGFVSHILFLGIIPTMLLWIVPFHRAAVLKELKCKVLIGLAITVVLVLCIATSSAHYASFFREHKSVRYYMNPVSAIHAVGKYIKQEIQASETRNYIPITKVSTIVESGTHRELVILIVGETARADHFSLNGYQRLTNPRLSAEKRIISYSAISSCGTATAISVPCMFSFSGRQNFDIRSAEYTENALDILKKAGVSVLWRDNNSDSKGVATRVKYQDFRSPELNPGCDIECRDTGMLDGLQHYIDSQSGDMLIVLHSMGSHGPAYFKRYPKEFDRFKPACNTLELSDCSKEEIVNAYDNTILYSDYFISQAIDLLKRNTPKYETTLIYISDHGESLGESGLYLHGMPYFLAPEEQTKVPIIIWPGITSDIDFEKTVLLKDEANSHDVVFSTLLNLFEVKTDLNYSNVKPLVYFKPE